MANENSSFSLELAQEYTNSTEQFPVDFELAWQWLNYSRKDVAKRAFDKCGFLESIDFSQFRQSVELDQGGNTYKDVIKLSVECFKTWAMMSNTPQGKQVRLYFLECEKIAKQAVITETHQQPQYVLPKRDMVDYIEAANKLENLPNGILKQLLRDGLTDQISLEQNLKYLPVAEKPKQYTIVKVRAKQLGYSDMEIGDGTRLGRFVKGFVAPAFQEMVGRFPVFHYEICPALDNAIHKFFS